MVKYLTREAIVEAAHGYNTKPVPAPEWGGTLLVRELLMPELLLIAERALEGGADIEMADLANITFDLTAVADLFPTIASWVIVNEDMESILTEEDVSRMTVSGMPVLERVIDATFELSSLEEPSGAAGNG